MRASLGLAGYTTFNTHNTAQCARSFFHALSKRARPAAQFVNARFGRGARARRRNAPNYLSPRAIGAACAALLSLRVAAAAMSTSLLCALYTLLLPLSKRSPASTLEAPLWLRSVL